MYLTRKVLQHLKGGIQNAASALHNNFSIRPKNVHNNLNSFRRDASTALQYADVLIIGGGAMGSSIAYFVKSKCPDLQVTVVERDSKVNKPLLTLGSLKPWRQPRPQPPPLDVWSDAKFDKIIKYLE